MSGIILLDLDGPLLDGRLRHHQCYADILTGHGFSYLNVESYWEMKRKRVSRREQLAATGAEAIYDIFLNEWLSNIERSKYLSLDRVQDGVHRTLNIWKELSHKVVVVTMRSNRPALIEQLQSNGLLAYFSDVLVCRHVDGGEGKASKVLNRYPDIRSESCLWVGDTEADADAAKQLGCPVWLLTCGLRTGSFLKELHPEYLSDHIVDVDTKEVFGD